MFEQALLTDGPAAKRAWTTFAGLGSQVALVSLAVLAPMVWPQALPSTHFWESLAPPMPPGPKPLRELKQEPVRVRAVRLAPWDLTKYQPVSVPDRIYMLAEEPPGPAVVGSLVGEAGGPGDGVVGGILQDLAKHMAPVAPPQVAAPPARAAVEPPLTIPRYKQGGNVQLGRVLRKGEAQYPQIAKAAHIAGEVELECVVGVDGHIHEVKVVSGHPLLVRAAMDAAWQWIYAPSQLNGTPIEIVTILKYSFKLN